MVKMRNMSTDKLYDIPVLPPDLRHEEMVRQICDALDHIDQVAKDIFTRIGKRIADNHASLHALNDRIALAQAKIDKVKGSNKAMKVFSAAKYPAADKPSDYTSVFGGNQALPPGVTRDNYKLHSKHKQLDEMAMKDKLMFYGVPRHTRRDEGSQWEGLGGLPANVPSVSSLLLFNTSENLYKKYVLLDPLGVVTKTRSTFEDTDEGLADAPSTIVQREELNRQVAENYFFVPGMGHVPEIAVPDFLPDLLGVADDLSYSADLGPSIAPSVPGSNMPDLPTVVPDLPAIVPDSDVIPAGPAQTGANTPATPTPPGPPPPPPTAAPPPPPPPPADIPPPPPPQSTTQPPPAPTVPAPTKAPKTPAPVDNGRAGLLESIRKAGGVGKAKLNSVKNRKQESKRKKKEQTSGATGGDLMGDLAAKLSLRRKGISGTSINTGSSGGGSATDTTGTPSMMERMSSIIPPPPNPMDSKQAPSDDWD